MTHVTIIGGGITGLAAAFYLQKKAAEQGRSISYTLLEASARLGGKVITRTEADFVMEGGPDSFITQKPWGLQLCQELGIGDRLIPCRQLNPSVYLLQKNRLIPLPHGLRLTVPTELMPFITSPLISWPGKLRMACDLFIPARRMNGDESLAQFIGRRLGREAVEKFAGPLMAGIFVADPHKLSIQGTFPGFAEMEQRQGSLIRSMLKARRANRGAPAPPMFMSLRGGMAELTEALARSLTGEIRTGVKAARIRRSAGHGYEIELGGETERPLRTDAIILAVPAYEAARLVEPVSPAVADRLRMIRYVSTATVSLAFRQPDLQGQVLPVGFGFVIPESERRDILACTCSSHKFSDRAPADGVLMRVFIGGDKKQHLVDRSDQELLALARAELAVVLGIRAIPAHQAVFRWRQGNPQYDVGHLDRVEQMENMLTADTGLCLAGSAYRGVGLPDCIHGAMQAADQVLAIRPENL